MAEAHEFHGTLEWANRLDKALERKGITNVQLAAEMHVTDSAVSRWRSGERQPSPDAFAYLCYRAGVSADSMLGIEAETLAEIGRQLEAICAQGLRLAGGLNKAGSE